MSNPQYSKDEIKRALALSTCEISRYYLEVELKRRDGAGRPQKYDSVKERDRINSANYRKRKRDRLVWIVFLFLLIFRHSFLLFVLYSRPPQ